MFTDVLITGGNGFVGKNFNFGTKLLKQECDLLDFQKTIYVFRHYQPDAIIHTAGRIGGVIGNMEAKGRYCYENVAINTNVIEAASLAGVKRVLSFLSSCAYPLNAPLPYEEKTFHDGLPHFAHYGYAYSKRMLDIMSRAYSEQYGVVYNSLIFSNIYGPNDNFGKEYGHVVPSLVAKCYQAKKYNTPFVVWGTGIPMRELIYVEDIVAITRWALDHYVDTQEPLNIGNPQQTSIKELAETIAHYMDFTGKIEWDSTKPDGQQVKPTSMKKFTRLYGEFQFTSLEAGIQKTIKWYIEEMKKHE